ncbi:hypothetical protein QF038_002027 [Pseudarthrobacter sp. W1I19]|nr:hypothetical protein [Pseudarthrobacter sp. W1I19]
MMTCGFVGGSAFARAGTGVPGLGARPLSKLLGKVPIIYIMSSNT